MRLRLLVACLAAGVLSGCSPPPGEGGGAEAVPQSRPTSGTELRVAPGAMVIDSGSGAELCLSAIQTSDPPGCTGVPLVGWKWPAGSERRAGVRWGTYSVVGTYDGKRFTVRKTIDEHEASGYVRKEVDYDFASRCPTPKGGWRAPEPGRATEQDEDRVFSAAEKLPGYSTSWIDDQGHSSQGPLDVVVNVQVTGDVDEATRTLRRVWGGSLCVSSASHTEKEISAVSDALMKRPDALGCGFSVDFLEYDVVYDDGSLQRQFDEEYGKGLIKVTSALHRYRG